MCSTYVSPTDPQVTEEKTSSLDHVHQNFKFANSWLRQFIILSKRAFTQVCMLPATPFSMFALYTCVQKPLPRTSQTDPPQNARDIFPLFFAFVLTAFIGVLLGVVYFQIDYNQRGIQDRLGILFFIVLFSCFSNFQPVRVWLLVKELHAEHMYIRTERACIISTSTSTQVMDTFPSEQKVVMRERAAKSYRVLPCMCVCIVLPAILACTCTMFGPVCTCSVFVHKKQHHARHHRLR